MDEDERATGSEDATDPTDEAVTGTSPEEAFSLVANETRFDILQALWAAETGEGTKSLSFSALQDRTGIRDSGQFNYHLSELTPRFVRGTDDGYELTFAGTQIIGAAVSGVYTDAETRRIEPVPVGTCPECGADIEAGYEAGHITIACSACDVTVSELPAPPVLAADVDPEDLPLVFSRRLRSDISRLNSGFCWLCGGHVETRLDRSFTDEVDADGDRLGVVYTCNACGKQTGGVVGAAVLDHPAVVGFLHDQGADLRETYLWELDWLFEAHATVTDEAPVRLDLEVEYGGETLRLRLDGELSVLEAVRSDG